MGSEDQVTSLMNLLDNGLNELERLDLRLTKYDDQLKVSKFNTHSFFCDCVSYGLGFFAFLAKDQKESVQLFHFRSL